MCWLCFLPQWSYRRRQWKFSSVEWPGFSLTPHRMTPWHLANQLFAVLPYSQGPLLQDIVKMNQLQNLLHDALIATNHVQSCAILKRKDAVLRASSVGFTVSTSSSSLLSSIAMSISCDPRHLVTVLLCFFLARLIDFLRILIICWLLRLFPSNSRCLKRLLHSPTHHMACKSYYGKQSTLNWTFTGTSSLRVSSYQHVLSLFKDVINTVDLK